MMMEEIKQEESQSAASSNTNEEGTKNDNGPEIVYGIIDTNLLSALGAFDAPSDEDDHEAKKEINDDVAAAFSSPPSPPSSLLENPGRAGTSEESKEPEKEYNEEYAGSDSSPNHNNNERFASQTKAYKSCCGTYCAVLNHPRCCKHAHQDAVNYCAMCRMTHWEELQQRQNNGEDSSDHSSDHNVPHCPICFDELPPEEQEENDVDLEAADGKTTTTTNGTTAAKKTVTVGGGCQHVFCSPCLIQSIESDIKSRTYPSCCPICSVELRTDTVRDILSTKQYDPDGRRPGDLITDGPMDTDRANKQLMNRYVILEKLSRDPSFVECVKCHDAFQPEENGNNNNKDSSMQLCCTHCGHNFCRLHGDSHQGMSCKEWLHKTDDGRRFRRTEKKMKLLTKPCPHCGVQIQKVDGCNHVHCTHCQKDMCWKCGVGYNHGQETHVCAPRFLRPIFPRGFYPSDRVMDFLYCLGEVLGCVGLVLGVALLSIIWIVVGVVVALVSGCCLLGWCCWKREGRDDGDRDDWGDYNPKRGTLHAVVLTCYPIAKISCLEDAVDKAFPGWDMRVEVAISKVLSGIRAVWSWLKACFGRGGADFPLMPVVAKQNNDSSNTIKETEKKGTNDSTNETVGPSSSAEMTV